MTDKAADVRALRAELFRLRRMPKREDRKDTRDVCLVLLDLWTEHGLHFPTERHREAWVRFARESDSRYLDEDPLLERWPFPVPPGYEAPMSDAMSCNRLPRLTPKKYAYHEDNFAISLIMVGFAAQSSQWKFDCFADFATSEVHSGVISAKLTVIPLGDGYLSSRTVENRIEFPHKRLGSTAYDRAVARVAEWRQEHETILYGLVSCPLPPRKPANKLAWTTYGTPPDDRLFTWNADIVAMYFPPERDAKGVMIARIARTDVEHVRVKGLHGETMAEVLSVLPAIRNVTGLMFDDMPHFERTLLRLCCWQITNHTSLEPTTPEQVTELADLVRPVVRKIELAYRALIRDLLAISPIRETP